MTFPQREEMIKKLLSECEEIRTRKGADYATKDVNSNFPELGYLNGLSKYQIWSVHASKQFISILHAIRENPYKPTLQGEPIEERIRDVVNYCFILYSMLDEETETVVCEI